MPKRRRTARILSPNASAVRQGGGPPAAPHLLFSLMRPTFGEGPGSDPPTDGANSLTQLPSAEVAEMGTGQKRAGGRSVGPQNLRDTHGPSFSLPRLFFAFSKAILSSTMSRPTRDLPRGARREYTGRPRREPLIGTVRQGSIGPPKIRAASGVRGVCYFNQAPHRPAPPTRPCDTVRAVGGE